MIENSRWRPWVVGRYLQHEVCVDQVVERLKENGQKTEAGKDTGSSGHDPVDIGAISRPAEPEDTTGEGDTAGNDDGQTPLGNRDTVVGGKFALV